jgi:hypothetical protein
VTFTIATVRFLFEIDRNHSSKLVHSNVAVNDYEIEDFRRMRGQEVALRKLHVS